MNYSFDYYVIHLKRASDRFLNIENMEIILGKKINIFNGIDGFTQDLNKLSMIDINLKLKYNTSKLGQLGCYLSHYNLYKNLIDSQNQYSIIFEDDFLILDENLNNKIINYLNLLKNKEFDYLFLGHNSIKGINIIDNIYFPNTSTTNNKIWGFHAYIINNKSIPKILKYLVNIDNEIDLKIFNLIKKKELIGFFINPTLVNQNSTKFNSLIRKKNIINPNILIKTRSNNTRLNNTRSNNTRSNNTKLTNTKLNNTKLNNTKLTNTRLNNTRLKNTRLKNDKLKKK